LTPFRGPLILPSVKDGISEAELLARVKREGCKVTPRQLKRYRLAGLLHRPAQVHVPGKRGSQSSYPTAALPQLRAICRLRERERRLDELGFWLWWEGHWVDGATITRILSDLCSSQFRDLRRFAAEHADSIEAGEALAAQATSSKSPVTRALRRRIGRNEDDFESALVALFALSLGETPIWKSPDVGLDDEETEASVEQTLERATGLDRATTDSPGGIGPLLDSPPHLPTVFGELQGHLSQKAIDSLISSITAAELERARLDAKVIAEDVPDFVAALESQFGRNVMGLGIFRLFGQKGSHALTWRAMLIPLMARLRGASDEENLDQVLDSFRSSAVEARRLLALIDERKEKGGG
jgi:hypothetical protein